MIRAILVAAIVFLTSCSGGSSLRCVDDGNCDGIAVCNEVGLCQEVECTRGDQCGLGQRCTEENTCETGCDGDQDCLAGETCNGSNQCEPYGCRSTSLDCNYGERCNSATGQCEFDSAPHCQANCTQDSCSQQSPGAACACFELDASGGCAQTYCLVACNAASSDPCPRGYQCQQAFQGDPTTFCIADCEFVSGL